MKIHPGGNIDQDSGQNFLEYLDMSVEQAAFHLEVKDEDFLSDSSFIL
jgi:hypothetical protein